MTKDPSKTFSIRIELSLLDWLKKQAENDRRSLNNYISNILEDFKANENLNTGNK